MRSNIFKKWWIFYQHQKLRISQFIQKKELTTLSDQFQNLKQVQKIKWKQHTYPFLNDFFLRFLNSKSHSGVVSGAQVLFITGAQNIGKTRFIKQNISAFKKKKQKIKKKIPEIQQDNDPSYLLPETMQETEKRKYENQHYLIINPKISENLTFYGFLHILEQQIINQVITKSKQINSLLTLDILYKIFLSHHSENYIEIYAKDYIIGLLTDLELILLDQESKTQLNNIYEDYFMKAKLYCKLIFKDKFVEIVKILAKHFNNNQLQACIRLFIGITHKIQYQHRPSQYTNSYYRTGIQTTFFLFDVINFITGVHQINLEFVRKYFTQNYQPTNNFIFDGNHIDSVLILQDLFKSKCTTDVKFLNWFDHLLLRTINQSNLRTHFPIVIQMKCSNQIKDIFRFGRLNLDNPVVIDIFGYKYGRIEQSNLLNIFDKKIVKTLWPYLGSHVELWKRAINYFMKDENNSLVDLIEKSDFLQKDSIILHAKINKIYTEPKIIPYLDDSTLNNRIIQFLQLFLDTQGNLGTMQYRNVVEIFENPIMQCMNEIGITHEPYYYDIYQVKYQTYLRGMNELIKMMKKNKLNYTIWNMLNSISRKRLKHKHRIQHKAQNHYQIYSKRLFSYQIQEYYSKPQAYFQLHNDQVLKAKQQNFN